MAAGVKGGTRASPDNSSPLKTSCCYWSKSKLNKKKYDGRPQMSTNMFIISISVLRSLQHHPYVSRQQQIWCWSSPTRADVLYSDHNINNHDRSSRPGHVTVWALMRQQIPEHSIDPNEQQKRVKQHNPAPFSHQRWQTVKTLPDFFWSSLRAFSVLMWRLTSIHLFPSYYYCS